MIINLIAKELALRLRSRYITIEQAERVAFLLLLISLTFFSHKETCFKSQK